MKQLLLILFGLVLVACNSNTSDNNSAGNDTKIDLTFNCANQESDIGLKVFELELNRISGELSEIQKKNVGDVVVKISTECSVMLAQKPEVDEETHTKELVECLCSKLKGKTAVELSDAAYN